MADKNYKADVSAHGNPAVPPPQKGAGVTSLPPKAGEGTGKRVGNLPPLPGDPVTAPSPTTSVTPPFAGQAIVSTLTREQVQAIVADGIAELVRDLDAGIIIPREVSQGSVYSRHLSGGLQRELNQLAILTRQVEAISKDLKQAGRGRNWGTLKGDLAANDQTSPLEAETHNSENWRNRALKAETKLELAEHAATDWERKATVRANDILAWEKTLEKKDKEVQDLKARTFKAEEAARKANKGFIEEAQLRENWEKHAVEWQERAVKAEEFLGADKSVWEDMARNVEWKQRAVKAETKIEALRVAIDELDLNALDAIIAPEQAKAEAEGR